MTGKASTVELSINDRRDEHPSANRIRGHPPSEPAEKKILTGARAVNRVRHLAWQGRHTQAIERGNQSTNQQITLLDQRVDSYIAIGEFEEAAKDAILTAQQAGAHPHPQSRPFVGR